MFQFLKSNIFPDRFLLIGFYLCYNFHAIVLSVKNEGTNDMGKQYEPTWRIEAQEWWKKYSAMMQAKQLEAGSAGSDSSSAHLSGSVCGSAAGSGSANGIPGYGLRLI